MKKHERFLIVIICLAAVMVLSACGSQQNIGNTEKYYTIENFQSITIGESTIRDVCEFAPIEVLYVTSYGGLHEFPMEDGDYIQVKFYGKDMVVGAIETTNSSITNTENNDHA